MANTITDLYLKYVNRVGKTLENDRYFQYLFEMVQAGETTLQQTHQILHKTVDERWLGVIEESLDALNRITEKPRRFVTTTEEVVPVALAKKITADSVRHLSMNTQFIASNESGEIHPTRILNVTTEETYDLYENRFIYHLIQRLVAFIDKRTDVIFWSTGDETRNTLKMHSKVDDAYEQIEYNLEITVKNQQSFAENDSDNMQVFMRIDRVRRMVMALRNSSFCEIMAGCARVTSPIQRTNMIMKDPDYRTCFKLWQFLESYEEVGYTIDVRDTALEFDEEYLVQLYSNLITNYTVFKSLLEADPRKLAEAPPRRRRVVKPKFLKQIEEQIVNDYNIPDVEIRKVLIEEVTQAQLDAEEKLAEEIALREAAEAARADAEQALQEYRWQVEFQQSEMERQAEERLQYVKEQAQAELQKLQASMEAARQQAEETLTQEKAAAVQREAELQASMEAARQQAEEALAQEKAAAVQREAELQASMEAARQQAEEALSQEKTAAAQREAELQTSMEAARQQAEEALTQEKTTAARRESELRAVMAIELQKAQEALLQERELAAQREAGLREELAAAQQKALARESEEAARREAELRAEMEAALQQAEQQLARVRAEAGRKEEKLQAALNAARKKAEDNRLVRRLAEAMAQRRDKDAR